MNTILAFLFRDLAIERTYRFHLAIKLAGVAMQLAVFFFISRFLEKPEYFVFVFAGIMFSGFFQFWLNVFSENIRQEQYWGTIEPIFMSAASPLRLVLSSAAGKSLFMFAEIVFFVILGKFLFGPGFNLNVPGFVVLAALNAAAFAGLGLLSGSFIMYFKRGDPVNWAVGAVFDLLSGVYFPVAVLPDMIKGFSRKLPTTSALDLWRMTILEGKMPDIAQFAAQAGWAVVLFCAGAIAFRIAFDKTRMKGDLGSY